VPGLSVEARGAEVGVMLGMGTLGV
jgi:hypothetical protein